MTLVIIKLTTGWGGTTFLKQCAAMTMSACIKSETTSHLKITWVVSVMFSCSCSCLPAKSNFKPLLNTFIGELFFVVSREVSKTFVPGHSRESKHCIIKNVQYKKLITKEKQILLNVNLLSNRWGTMNFCTILKLRTCRK